MLLFEYFVFNSLSVDNPRNTNPAVFRRVYGINDAGAEYIGCLSNILDSVDFYKRNLEVALDKIRKLEYDLKTYKENTDGTNQPEA
jgi:hypothetical protein